MKAQRVSVFGKEQKGRNVSINLPVQVRQSLDIHVGDYLSWEIRGDALVLQKENSKEVKMREKLKEKMEAKIKKAQADYREKIDKIISAPDDQLPKSIFRNESGKLEHVNTDPFPAAEHGRFVEVPVASEHEQQVPKPEEQKKGGEDNANKQKNDIETKLLKIQRGFDP